MGISFPRDGHLMYSEMGISVSRDGHLAQTRCPSRETGMLAGIILIHYKRLLILKILIAFLISVRNGYLNSACEGYDKSDFTTI
jgi:hypothetical protein